MQVEVDKLEWEVKRQTDIGLILANQLNEKIDECEALRKALGEVLSNHDDANEVIAITSEALYGDR
jgi:hypothetical protein